MGCRLHWAPEEPGAALNTSMASHTWELLKTLTNATGEFDIKLSQQHVPALRALAIADSSSGVWNDLIKALDRHGAIRVYSTN